MHFYDPELLRLRARTHADPESTQANVSAAIDLARRQGGTLFECGPHWTMSSSVANPRATVSLTPLAAFPPTAGFPNWREPKSYSGEPTQTMLVGRKPEPLSATGHRLPQRRAGGRRSHMRPQTHVPCGAPPPDGRSAPPPPVTPAPPHRPAPPGSVRRRDPAAGPQRRPASTTRPPRQRRDRLRVPSWRRRSRGWCRCRRTCG